jgi:hypothetical protein
MELPKELVDAACSNNLVIWVGAGLSYNLINKNGNQLKGWGDFVELIIDSFPEEKYLTSMLMKSVRYIYDPIQRLDILEVLSSLPKNEILNYVKYFYSISDYERSWLQENSSKQIISKENVRNIWKNYCSLSNKQDWGLHIDLCELSNIIITTNYDNAFELVCEQINRPIKIVLLDETIGYKKLDDLNETILIKLHGSISNKETMVIFPYDYAYFYEHQAHSLILELRKLILTKTMLFIGCGMGDWQINNIFKFGKEKLSDLSQKHFIIETGKKFDEIKQKDKKNTLDFLTLIPITKYNPDKESTSDERNINNIIKLLIKEKNSTKHFQVEFDYYHQADEIFAKAALLKDENLLEQSCELYKKSASLLQSRNADVFYKWGIVLFELGELRKSEKYYLDCIDKLNISAELNPIDIEKIHLLKIRTRNRIEQLDINSIIKNCKNMIPVKTCLGDISKFEICGCINSCESLICKRCGRHLGKEWSDYGHLSAGVCGKCNKYVGAMGERCPICGDEVPFNYKDFNY